MVRAKKAKKPLSKGRLIVRRILRTIGLLALAALILFLILFGKTAFRLAFIYLSQGYDTVDIKLTAEQKIKDLDYMYDLACLQNPRKELFEQAYGISYEDVYKKYRDLVANSKTEYEFVGYMSCFIAELPGEHNNMDLPDYQMNAVDGGFQMIDLYGYKDVKNHICSYKEAFRDEVKKYADHKAIIFSYIEGKYIAYIPNGKEGYKTVDTYAGGELVKLNGKDPADMCFNVFERYTPRIDSKTKKCFRSNLIFNDKSGEKFEAEILMPDGKTVTAVIYDDPGFDIQLFDAKRLYPEPGEKPEGEQTPSSEEVFSENYVATSYKIEKDKDRKLVYINSLVCDAREGKRIAQDIQAAIDEVDADTIILDLRQNGGGTSSFANKQLLPVLFSHDVEFAPKVVGKYNKQTREFNNTFNKLFFKGSKIEKKDGYFYYAEDFSVKGEAKKNYKIYVLTSHRTFSTADIIAALCKEYDGATLVGTNTGGEGIGGAPVNCILPESRLGFIYVPTVSVKYPEDGISGIEPDIFAERTVKEMFTQQELSKKGEDISSYESRKNWDNVLIKVLDIIDGERSGSTGK